MLKNGLYFCLLLILSMGFAAPLQPVQAAETDCSLHDPSTIVKSSGMYWIYGTGRGIPEYSSLDRLHWVYRGQVFPTAPSWVASAVPANTNNFAWAPDIRFFHGKWHLYYSFSTFGSNHSGIGVATNKTLDPRKWIDQGIVVQSGKETSYNAIDPGITLDADGTPWLSFGSFFSGIQLIQLDKSTGKKADTDPHVYMLSSRPQSSDNAIEASDIVCHGGLYYLFVNWDSCCRGEKSTYQIRVGRSRSIRGPYLDRAGAEMTRGGGTLFLATAKSSGDGTVVDEIGPGHAGVLLDSDGDFLSCAYEWARDRSGQKTVNLLKLTWDEAGWPHAD